MKQEKIYIYGRHALMEALLSRPKSVQKVFLAPGVEDQELKDTIRRNGIRIAKLSDKEVRKVGSTATHQGVIGIVSLSELLVPYKEFAENLQVNDGTSLVLMGEIQDPQNVGAIIRSATAFGVSGVLIPQHNQSPVTGAVVKVSAGMAFRIPLVTIGNVNETLRDLKKRGFWIYGLEGEAKQMLGEEQFDAPSVFVLGNESKGIREKTQELCDILLKIPMSEKSESLNVAASAAVALYAWSTKHPNALTQEKE